MYYLHLNSKYFIIKSESMKNVLKFFGVSTWLIMCSVQYNGGLLPDIILLTQ